MLSKAEVPPACVFGFGPRNDNHFNQILMHPFRCIHSAFVVAVHSHGCSFPRWTLMMRLIISAFSYTLVFGVVCSCSSCSQVCPEVALWTSGYLIRGNDATQWALIREKQTVCLGLCAVCFENSVFHSAFKIYFVVW